MPAVLAFIPYIMKKTALFISLLSLTIITGCGQYTTKWSVSTSTTTEISSNTWTQDSTTEETTEEATAKTPCPAMPTVDSCPTNQEKYLAFSSPDCGEYYACRTKSQVSTPVSQVKTIVSKNIDIINFGFSSLTLSISVGSKVTRTNSDTVPHTILADDSSFQSTTLQEGEKFSFTFTKAWTYNYHCSIHPSMKGTIIVK